MKGTLQVLTLVIPVIAIVAAEIVVARQAIFSSRSASSGWTLLDDGTTLLYLKPDDLSEANRTAVSCGHFAFGNYEKLYPWRIRCTNLGYLERMREAYWWCAVDVTPAWTPPWEQRNDAGGIRRFIVWYREWMPLSKRRPRLPWLVSSYCCHETRISKHSIFPYHCAFFDDFAKGHGYRNEHPTEAYYAALALCSPTYERVDMQLRRRPYSSAAE